MRLSTARLTNSPVRLADLSFPQAHRLIHRMRLAFIHLENVLSFAKRDRDGRVDGFLHAWLPDECVLIFLRKGEPVSAATLSTSGRQIITIGEALRRMRAEPERGEIAYGAAPQEQLAWMHQSCSETLVMKLVDPNRPEALFPALAHEKATGVLELIVDGRVSYLRFDAGRYLRGYFCDKPPEQPVPRYIESLFKPGPDGAAPMMAAALFPAADEVPVQAPVTLVSTYRELYWRIVDAVEVEMPGEGRRRAARVSGAITGTHRALGLLCTPRGVDIPESVVQTEELAVGLTDWALQLLESVEVMMPGTAPKVLREATREQRFVLQAAGFYDRLPWPVTW